MPRIQSPTLSRLVLIGFVVVTAPLAVGIITAIAQVDRLARDSRSALVTVQENATLSRTLADRITAMERSARQLHAVNDPSFRDLYEEHRQEALSLYERLQASGASPEMLAGLRESRRLEEQAHALIDRIGAGVSENELADALDRLRESVVEVVQRQNALAREMANDMPDQARGLQRTLIAQAALVFPLSVMLGLIFVVLIARPLRQIDSSIHALGSGSLDGRVHVTGTRDLEELGRRLEWLRLRLLELEAEKSRFLRSVSHELKTPLTNIRESAELLVEPGVPDSGSETGIITKVLRDNTLRLQQMIEELLRYGAEGSVGDGVADDEIQFDLLIAEILDGYELTMSARSIDVNRSLEPVVVIGNARRLQAIVDNLLSNAFKYTPDRGRIDVELTGSGGTATLDVRDNGPGVPDGLAARVFDWFVTGPRPPQWKVAGTGMGLAIARDYARQLKGDINLVPSKQGAHFRLTIRTNPGEEN